MNLFIFAGLVSRLSTSLEVSHSVLLFTLTWGGLEMLFTATYQSLSLHIKNKTTTTTKKLQGCPADKLLPVIFYVDCFGQ